MVAFNFKQQFVPPIERGQKIQTIRSKQRCHVGDTMQLYTGMRTKQCRLIKIVTCLSSVPVILKPTSIEVFSNMDFRTLDQDATLRFARADGFPHYPAMIDWFRDTYGKDSFMGFVHRWALSSASM